MKPPHGPIGRESGPQLVRRERVAESQADVDALLEPGGIGEDCGVGPRELDEPERILKRHAQQHGLWQRLRREGWRGVLLLSGAVCALAVIRLVVLLVPFRVVAQWAGRRPRRSPPDEQERADLVRRVRWAVPAAARRVPWQATCLTQGLVAQQMLRRRGIPAVLYLGASTDATYGLLAHAWVYDGPLPVVGDQEAEQYSVLARIPDDRATLTVL